MNADLSAMPAPEWDLQEARRIVTAMLDGYPAAVYLFGSRAQGTMGRFSDIDIAVLPRAPLPEGLLSQVREALEESWILYRVDLVDLSEVPEAFRQKVVKQGVLWKG